MKIKRIAIFLMAIAMTFTVFGLSSCGDTSASQNSSADGSENTSSSVPSDIGTGELSAVFYFNDGTENVYTTVHYESNKWVTNPGTPPREGYYFDGWYIDEACTQKFDFNSRRSESTVAYASWRKIYTFEAEYTHLTEHLGQGYSGNCGGLQLISPDKTVNKTASNGYYVTSLFYNGAYLRWEIQSEEAVTDATLVLRLSAEFDNITLTDDEVILTVNAQEEYNVEATLTGVYSTTENGENIKRDFTNHTVATKVSLQEGKNVIEMIVNNSVRGSGGTMEAKAPMVDCLYIYTNAELTWTPENTIYTTA